MKRTVPRSIAPVIASLLLAISTVTVQAGGLSIRIGDGGHGHQSHGSGFHTYGPVTSFGHTYGPVTSFGLRHNLSGRNKYNLNTTRPGHDLRKRRFKSFRFKSFHDRDKARLERHHHKSHGSAHKRGFRHGFGAGQHRNRSLHHRW